MKVKWKRVLDVLEQVVAGLFMLGMLVTFIVGIKSCSDSYDAQVARRPPYAVSYGNAWSSSVAYFYTYKVENSHYIFYDEAGGVVKDVYVTGNN